MTEIISLNCAFNLKMVELEKAHFPLLEYKSRAWCKTIVTTSFYIRSYSSFALSHRNRFKQCDL